MIVMSIEDHEDLKFRAEIDAKLTGAEFEAATTTTRYTLAESMKLLKARLDSPSIC